jgi:hypothetical protein
MVQNLLLVKQGQVALLFLKRIATLRNPAEQVMLNRSAGLALRRFRHFGDQGG